MQRLSTAGRTVLELAEKHGCPNQAALRRRIEASEGIELDHQKVSQWVRGVTSFPNDFAPILTRALGLTPEEQVELALALSFGQKTRVLRRREPA